MRNLKERLDFNWPQFFFTISILIILNAGVLFLVFNWHSNWPHQDAISHTELDKAIQELKVDIDEKIRVYQSQPISSEDMEGLSDQMRDLTDKLNTDREKKEQNKSN